MKTIVVVDKNWGIGKDNDLLFRLKEDMKHFKQKTIGATVVMGLRTFESLPGKRILPNRKNIVLGGKDIQGALCPQSLAELAALLKCEKEEIFVIGGASVYRTMLPFCEEAIVTKVDATADAEVFFENLDQLPDWALESESESITDGDYSIKFTVYKNKNVKDFVAENL